MYEWENLPEGVNRLVDTHSKKEITLIEKMDDQESIEEYAEVVFTHQPHHDKKRFMSSNDLEDDAFDAR